MNHSAPKILYTASSSAHLVSFHLPYLAALRSLGWDVNYFRAAFITVFSFNLD